MKFNEMIDAITPDIFERLVQAVELGKWPDGVKLTEEQRANCIQLIKPATVLLMRSSELVQMASW